MIAAAVHAGLSGAETMKTALAAYQANRNRNGAAMFDFTCQQASLEPPPLDMQHLLEAISLNQRDTDRFMSLFAGSQRLEEFFAPDNLARISQAS